MESHYAKFNARQNYPLYGKTVMRYAVLCLFSSLLNAMITLFQLFTLDQWYKIYNDLTKVSNVAFTCTYILLWVWIGAFVFRNLFVGIMGEYACFPYNKDCMCII